jgi:hypothetical protein
MVEPDISIGDWSCPHFLRNIFGQLRVALDVAGRIVTEVPVHIWLSRNNLAILYQ